MLKMAKQDDGVLGKLGPGALQALVALDYILIVVMRTAAGVLLGRRREALSSRH